MVPLVLSPSKYERGVTFAAGTEETSIPFPPIRFPSSRLCSRNPVTGHQWCPSC